MNTLLKKLTQTDNSTSSLILRVFLGLVLLPHGLQKTLGLFGGYGFSGTMEYFTGTAGLPTLVAFLVIMAESLGAIALILGLLTRFCAASITILMLGAIQTVHFQYGFFMNWFGNQKGEGFEYHLLVIGMSLALVISGGGKYSLDQKISQNNR